MRSVKLLASGSVLVAVALLAGSSALEAQSRVEVGVLNCRVEGGAGFVFGSSKRLACNFNRQGPNERYTGTITKYGIDVGVTNQTYLSWAVFAPTTRVPRGALRGNYGGISGEATIGVGVGANALVGGSNQTIVLQPLSVQTQQGLNIAAGVAALQLR